MDYSKAEKFKLDSFSFSFEFWELFSKLPPEDYAPALNAICAFAFDGIEPEEDALSERARMLYGILRRSVANQKSMLIMKRESRSDAGRKGAQNRWKKAREEREKIFVPPSDATPKPEEPSNENRN